MSNLHEILKEEYIKEINKIDVKALMKMIGEALDSPVTIVEEEEGPSVAKMSDDKTLEMILQMIPEIEVSELGWGDVSGPEKDIKGPARLLLEGYLTNIQGTTLAEKIQSVEAFYGPGAVDMIKQTEKTADKPMTAKIKQAISYLVFYKTLTKVLTNFNASSAGFSFESFLAALSNGYQIPANKGTIADYIDRLEGEVPVSLKLYREKKLKVDGSYTDLVRDLVKPQFGHPLGHAMRYVVCTKDMETDPETDKPLPTAQQQGQILFWQFDFTIQNVMAILVNSMDKSQECIRLPREVVSKLNRGWNPTEEDGKNLLRLPAQMEASEDELEAIFLRKLQGNLSHLKEQNPQSIMRLVDDDMYDQLTKDINWKENDELFQPVELPPDEAGDEGEEEPREKKMGVRRGESKFNAKALQRWLKPWFDSYYGALPPDHPLVQTMKSLTKKQQTKAIGTGHPRGRGLLDILYIALRDANQGPRQKVRDLETQEEKFKHDKPEMDPRAGLIATQAAAYKKSERERILDEMEKSGEFLSPLESAAAYGPWANANDIEKMSIALYHTKGYLRRKHFFMNQTQATNGADPVIMAKGEGGIESIKAGGTAAASIGSIKVGGFYVGQVLNEIRKLLDKEIFDIFTELRSLSDKLNEYFAGGLEKDSLANVAIGNADAIAGTTEKLKKKY